MGEFVYSEDTRSRSGSGHIRASRLRSGLGSGLAFVLAVGISPAVSAQTDGEAPRLGVRVLQEEVEAARTPDDIRRIREEGLRIFSTPFNRLDGLGDGPIDPTRSRALVGNRPTIQNADTPFLRLNGLDAQTCLECHGFLSTTTIPFQFAVGGTAGFSASPFPGVVSIDGADADANGIAEVPGRVINPPINFGGGGISTLGKEMTAELLDLRATALANPGVAVDLVTKGVSFGTLVCFGDGSCDTSGVVGIDDDLVVKPFGRKGEFATTRSFDQGAFQFHMGVQPVEIVGADDADGDGVFDELTVGEMSAVSMFLEGLEPPAQLPRNLRGEAEIGSYIFEDIGCADCHIPELVTESPFATFSFPQVDTDPFANVFQRLDLRRQGFESHPGGGVRVALFADLKRHDMGDRLAESTGSPLARQFTTARLWGVADTAPYLHDGRATTLSEAILFHDGEGADASAAFAALSGGDRSALLAFLRTLRNPERPNQGLRSAR